jgi:hypothetical protein
MRASLALIGPCALLLAVRGEAQLLPDVSVPQVPVVGPFEQRVQQTIDRSVDRVRETTNELLQDRNDRITGLLQKRRKFIEPDANGEPAVRGELLVVDPDAALLAAVRAAGFTEAGTDRLGSLGVSITRLQLPRGMSLAEGQRALIRTAPAAEIAPDNLHFESGGSAKLVSAVPIAAAARSIFTPIGVIDGGTGKGEAVAAARGFASGAPSPSDHGSAVTSLLQIAGATRVLAADVFGHDPAGGNALAIIRALNWLSGSGARVVSISLVGPRNAAMQTAIAAALRKGMVIVAPVGNDGPAAPPAYPASYPGVLAVTGVDGHDRALIEAGRALHLDFAAPGADIRGQDKDGKTVRLRGTSYAVPLVAVRAAAALEHGEPWQGALDREAVDLGPKGPDAQYGRGLLCGECGRR